MKMKETEPHDISKCEIISQWVQYEVGNIGILVLWQVCEKLDCGN